MPQRHSNAGRLEKAAAGAATPIARNAGLGSAAAAHCVEGANHRPAPTRRLSHRESRLPKPAWALRHGKFLCARGLRQTAAGHPVSLRPFTASTRRQVSVSGPRHLVRVAWIRLSGSRHAGVRRGGGHSSWHARLEHVALAVAGLHPCRGGGVECHPRAGLSGDAAGGGQTAHRIDRHFRRRRDDLVHGGSGRTHRRRGAGLFHVHVWFTGGALVGARAMRLYLLSQYLPAGFPDCGRPHRASTVAHPERTERFYFSARRIP